MANLGISNASYYADTSISRLNRQVTESVDKVSSNKANITNGDKTSLVSIDNVFKIDLAATNAAVKNMSVAQAYLSTAISTLDNASAILRKIHELAVLGANGSNSDADNAALNIESEALIDAFHKSMTVAQFKGREVFMDEPNTLSLASGGRASSVEFGVGKVDYDVLYDYTNPGLTSLSSGVKYEIRRDLSDAEKAAILSRSSNLTADQLVRGFQFTTDAAPNNIGDGTITVNPNGTNVHNYAKGSGVQQFDATATANGITADFKEGFLELEISENYELSDNLSLRTAGNITVTDGVVFFTDPNQGNKVIEIGKVDETKNGQNGTILRINFHKDATIPGTSNLTNGDFSQTETEILGYNKNFDTVPQTQNRNGVLDTLTDANVPPNAITIVANMVGATHQNVTLTGGSGTGARVHIKTVVDGFGNENISEIQFLDKGKDYQIGDSIFVPNGTGAIGNTEIKVVGILDNQTVTLTQANFTNVTQNRKHPPGTAPGSQYNFDASGDPNGVPKLTYGPGDNVLNNRSRQVGENTVWETYIEQDIINQTYSGETTLTNQVFKNYTPINATVPKNWTRFLGRVDFGNPFTIAQYPTGTNQAGEKTGNVNVENPAPTIDTSGRVQYSVPTPTDAQMAQVAFAGTVNDNAPAPANVADGMSVAPSGGKLVLNTGQFTFGNTGSYGVLHGPAAVSDEFVGKKGQFLKLDYTANDQGDDYHVAGYIYKVDANGAAISAPIMAFNDTGKSGSGRASVEVPDDATYRFVFIVGTYDESGGKVAGAQMTIDNIVAEDPYTIGTGAVGEVLKAVHFENNANAANPNKTLVAKASDKDGTTVLTDDALINMQNFATTVEPDGPYMIAPTLNFTTQPSEGGTGSAVVLTKKIEVVQDRLNLARTQASSQVAALEQAIDSTTDLRSQFALGSGTLSDLNFSVETVNLTRRQMQQDVASSVLAQANKTQSSLVSLVDGSYRTYLNAQFSHLK